MKNKVPCSFMDSISSSSFI